MPRDDQRNRKKRRGVWHDAEQNLPEEQAFCSAISAADMLREKNRARELRRSEWWKRKRAAGVCYYCQRRVPPAELTMDHLIPLMRGGKSTKGNLVPACKDCNTKKKAALPWEWEG